MKTAKVKAVAGEAIISDKLQRFPDAAPAGSRVRQGDVYITRLDALPASCAMEANPSAQLAPGTTQGSRHCLKSLRSVS